MLSAVTRRKLLLMSLGTWSKSLLHGPQNNEFEKMWKEAVVA
jgi:hypothetical protein